MLLESAEGASGAVALAAIVLLAIAMKEELPVICAPLAALPPALCRRAILSNLAASSCARSRDSATCQSRGRSGTSVGSIADCSDPGKEVAEG